MIRRRRWLPRVALLLAAVPWLAVADDALQPRFEIKRFSVSAPAPLAPQYLQQLLQPYVGAQRSFADVERARERLRQALAEAGYGLAQITIPEQEISSGTVVLQVTLPRLSALRVEGNRHYDELNITRSLPALALEQALNSIALSRQLRLANESSAKRTAVELSTAADGLRATVQVQDEKPWRVAGFIDNSGTDDTGKTRLALAWQHDNVANRDQQLTVQFVTAPDQIDDVQVAGANYRMPIAAAGDSVELFGHYASVDAGVVSELFNVSGRGYAVGARYNHAFNLRGSYQSKAFIAIQLRGYDNRVTLAGGSEQLIGDVTVRPISVGYAGSWRPTVAGAATAVPMQIDFGAGYTRNWPGGENGRRSDFEAVRAQANRHYDVLHANLSVTFTNASDWQLKLDGEGQYTRHALVPGEQFGLGGARSVRGFEERELANDRGGRASVELRTPDFGARFGSGVAARALAFFDAGKLRRNKHLPGESVRESVSSIGVGMQVNVNRRASFRTDFAHVLDGAPTQRRGEQRLHFSFGLSY